MEGELKEQLRQEQDEALRTKRELQEESSKLSENEALLNAANR